MMSVMPAPLSGMQDLNSGDPSYSGIGIQFPTQRTMNLANLPQSLNRAVNSMAKSGAGSSLATSGAAGAQGKNQKL